MTAAPENRGGFLFGRDGGIGFKPDDRFIRLGIAKFFTGEACNGGGIIAQRVNVRAQLAGNGFLFLQFGIEPENFTAHPLILLNRLLVGQTDKNQGRQRDEDDDRLRELAPNAEINFHPASLTAHNMEVKADFTDNRQVSE